MNEEVVVRRLRQTVNFLESNALFAAVTFLMASPLSVESAELGSTQGTQAPKKAGQKASVPSSDGKIPQKADLPLTISQRWAMACPAVLTDGNRERQDSFDIWDRKPEYIEMQKDALRKWWNISNREELLRTLVWLTEGGGHREVWKEMTAIKDNADAAAFKARSGMDADDFECKLAVVRKHGKAFGDAGILGWDYCRYIALCRWGVYCGYLTKDEAWRKMMPIARILQRNFKSWHDLGWNYVVARKFWSQRQTEISGDSFEATLEKLTKDPKSPWNQIPWNTDLSPQVSNGY
ncbi:MAG: DUF1266 domain-containing protein [Cyanobacteria bacterium]|nr:DUF1266 domain-containing protein [Cyanobacteriota bacterium]